jgi:predicted transcriptional regulator
MSDKDLVLELVKNLPSDTSISEIAKEIEFMAGIREAEEQLDRGEGIPHAEVKKHFATWITKGMRIN